MGLYNWGLEYRWGPVKTDLAAESERIRRQIREAKEARLKDESSAPLPRHNNGSQVGMQRRRSDTAVRIKRLDIDLLPRTVAVLLNGHEVGARAAARRTE